MPCLPLLVLPRAPLSALDSSKLERAKILVKCTELLQPLPAKPHRVWCQDTNTIKKQNLFRANVSS